MNLKMTVENLKKGKMGNRRQLHRSQCALLMLEVITAVFVVPLFLTMAHGIHLNPNGGYEDIVVTIGKEVPPITCQQLIQNIQGIFTSASEYLHGATDGRVYFRRVMIIVPPMWDTRACGRSISINSYTSRSRTNDAAVRITMEHSIFGHLPWTQQSRGCGLPGDFISIGYHHILQFNGTESTVNLSNGGAQASTSDRNTESYGNSIDGQWSSNNGRNLPRGLADNTPKDRSFVHEWAKYRYGVFEEIGFPNDPIYPAVYSESGSIERKPTSCTNHLLRGNWSGGCTGWTPNSNNRNSTCKFSPITNSHENDRVTSSIMSFPQGRNVRKFCDSQTHNHRAPTKHNFLCDRKSTSEIIYENQDFRRAPLLRDQNVGVPQTEFIVKQITQPRFVLLVEETGNMNLRDVWKFLKLAVRKFIKYDLAGGTEIGMITVNSNDVRVLANMTSLQSLTIRRALADKLANYPNVDGGGNIAIRRGIFQAVEVLKRNQQRAAGSVIILISQGTVSPLDLEMSLELLREEEVSLASIEYPSTTSDGKIAALAEGTNGPHFTIRETGVGSMTHLSAYMHLINALTAIQKFYTEDVVSNWPVTIHQIEYRGDSHSYIEANFSFESTAVQSPGEFFIYTSNPNDPKINNVELISPNGIRYTTQLSDLHDINVIKIDALINEPGVWRYRIERLADGHQSHFVQVVTRTTTEDLYVRLYTNVPENKVANLSATPLILYTEVKRKNSPVIDADVEALIVCGTKRWTVTLLDNGNGDADVTRNDGVYSRYFILPPGMSVSQVDIMEISSRVIVNPYRAKFSVVSQDPLHTYTSQPCCGSFISPADPKQQYKLVPFGERSSNMLSLRVSENPPIGYYPPGRIGDLRLVSTDSYNRAATITWTAPGEDYDQGIVASYQIFYSVDNYNEDWKHLTKFTADIEAGIQDNTTIKFPHYGSFLVSMSGIDFYGKAGKISNILRVTIFQPGKEQPNGRSQENSYGISRTTPSTEELKDFDYSIYYYLYIIICAIVVLLLLSALIVLLLYCRKMGLSQRKPSKNGNEGKIAAITDPKSPIHWSASELLGEHEKRHSLYDGSASPGEDSTKSNHKIIQHPHHYVNHGLQNGSLQHHPMHLNIASQDYTAAGNSPSRTTHSPADSYDDPESPTPIPISVRSRHLSPTESPHEMSNNMSSSTNYLQSSFHPQYRQYQHQITQNSSGFPHAYTKAPNPTLVFPLTHNHHSHGSMSASSSTHSSNLSSNHMQSVPHNLRNHCDPEIQGSLNSVNSKKRNITMV